MEAGTSGDSGSGEDAERLRPYRTVRLGDGRTLAYLRSGTPSGRPVLFCHGTPGSRLFRPADDTRPATLGVDLVTVDRPGYGRSTAKPHRTLLDWPSDVEALADHLAWERFALVGISGGGPFALACGRRLPGRVTVVGVVSGVAPFWPGALRGMLGTTRHSFQMARWAPWLLVAASRRAGKRPERLLGRLQRELPECDRRIIGRPDVAGVLAENAPEALVGGEAGREVVLLRRDWGFGLDEVDVPVLLWHGEADRNVPVAHGRRIAAGLADCRPTFIPDAGHYFIFDRWAEILSGVAAES